LEESKTRTWAEVDLSAIEDNVRNMRSRLPDGCRFLGVVKADAYGHGAVPVAKRLERCGADYLAVACIDEAEELRAAGIQLPILILGATPADCALRLSELDVTQAVGSLAMGRAFSEKLTAAGRTLKVHLKLETGMGRTGFDVKRGDVSGAAETVRLPGLVPEGVFTHFAVSDEPARDGCDEYTKMQFRVFMDAVAKIEREADMRFQIRHCTNSGAMINYPEYYLDMVRPGIDLYGLYPGAERGNVVLRPAMALRSRIAAVTEHEAGDSISYGCTFTAPKKIRLAVVPIGYADGLHRVLSGKIDVLIHGVRCRQVGRICMDMCMVDVTDVPDVQEGDTATIFGADGAEEISVDELAHLAGTISYELLCAVSPRVPRVYIG
jgi:alanine racemase